MNKRVEPRLIEYARRAGWGLLALCLVLGGLVRFAGAGGWVMAGAVAAGMLGLLAIINVALVRGLYRQIDEVKSQVSGEE
ncbi:MAG: hypothetical protein ABL909_09900 [Sphingopyxis sp.]